MQTPPPGSPPGDIANFVDRLVRESWRDLRRQAWWEEAERGLNLFLGNHWITPAPSNKIRLVVNRIQNCVLSMVAIQAGDPPQVTFTARESGDKPQIYLNDNLPQGKSTAQDLIISGTVTDDGRPWTADLPLPDQVAQQLQQAVSQSEMIAAQAQAAGLPPPPAVLPDDFLVEVTDQACAQSVQTIYDAGWDEANGQFHFVENIGNKNILGWQPTVYGFDDTTKTHVFQNVHPYLVYPDPMKTDSTTWNYVVYFEPISRDEALDKWPQFEEQIDECARQGTLIWPGASAQMSSAAVYSQAFERDMLVIRHAWIKGVPYPLTPQEAIDTGALNQQQVPTGPPQMNQDASGNVICADCGSAFQADGGLTPDLGCPVCGSLLSTTPTRTAMVDPSNGNEVTTHITNKDGSLSPHPKWPMRIGIREITIIGNTTAIISDKECEHNQIPIAANKNTPIPFSPYGQGEPKRLEGLQMAINRVMSAMVTHHAYNAHPPEVVDERVIDRMDKAIQKMRTQPNQRIAIPADLMEEVKGDVSKLITTLGVPALPSDFWQLLNLLIQLIDKEGNQADVAQGDAAAGWSGEAIASLQNAHNQVVRGKSLFTEFYLKQMARMMVNSIVTRMTPQDWQKYLGAKPIQAIEALHRRSKSLDIDIAISIKSGSGAAKSQQTQTMIAAKQAGVAPVSTPTIMDALDLDADAEAAKEAAYQRKVQQLQGSPIAPAAAPSPAQTPNPASNNAVQPGMVPGQQQQGIAA